MIKGAWTGNPLSMKKISFLGLEMSGREQGKGRLQKHHPGCKITLTSILCEVEFVKSIEFFLLPNYHFTLLIK